MSDLINRQDAIDVARKCPVKEVAPAYMLIDKSEIMTELMMLPSAQPEERTKERTETHACDCISRQAVIGALKQMRKDGDMVPWEGKNVFARIRKMPSAQPDIIRCRNCKFASGDSRICMKFGHSPIGELDFCAWAERRTDG